jgi:hypothetical protein
LFTECSSTGNIYNLRIIFIGQQIVSTISEWIPYDQLGKKANAGQRPQAYKVTLQIDTWHLSARPV